MHKNWGTPIQLKSIRYSLYSLLALLVTMIFLFPIYWAFSTSLRNPIDTFTVSGLGIPFIHFEPTLDNWINQLSTGEATTAMGNSTIIAVSASLLALFLGTPAAYALARLAQKYIVRGLIFGAVKG